MAAQNQMLYPQNVNSDSLTWKMKNQSGGFGKWFPFFWTSLGCGSEPAQWYSSQKMKQPWKSKVATENALTWGGF